ERDVLAYDDLPHLDPPFVRASFSPRWSTGASIAPASDRMTRRLLPHRAAGATISASGSATATVGVSASVGGLSRPPRRAPNRTRDAEPMSRRSSGRGDSAHASRSLSRRPPARSAAAAHEARTPRPAHGLMGRPWRFVVA